MRHLVLISIALAALCFAEVSAQIEGIYCGKDNCYDLLGVTRDDDRKTIMSAYRKLARKLHPDRQRTEEERKKAEETFPRIAQAYEILRDEEQRKEYDYMLDNPEEMYYHYYQYFKRRMAPKVDVRIVLFVLITAFSVVQYYSQWTNYNDALNAMVKHTRYRTMAKDIAKREGLLDDAGGKRKRENGKRMSKEEAKEREERVIREVIVKNMDIRGSYEPPALSNVLWCQLLLLPWRIATWTAWAARWFVLFVLLKREYGEQEKEFLMRRNLGLSQLAWDSLPEQRRSEFWRRELWLKPNFVKFSEEEADRLREQMANDPKQKKMRRFMKKGGAGQITFGQEDVDMDYN